MTEQCRIIEKKYKDFKYGIVLIIFISLVLLLCSCTFENPKKPKDNNGNHYGTQTLPVGDGSIIMLSMAVLYVSVNLTRKIK